MFHDLYQIFIQSCEEQLAGVEDALLTLASEQLEVHGTTARRNLEAAYRAAHSIKADAGAMGLTLVVQLAHALEEVLSDLKEGRIAGENVIAALLHGFDVLRRFIGAGEDADEDALNVELEALDALRDGHNTPDPVAARADPVDEPDGHETVESAAFSHLNVDAHQLDELVDDLGELAVAHSRLESLAIRRGDEELGVILEEAERIVANLRDRSVSMRLLPLSLIAGRYRRLVFELAHELRKEVEFTLTGENTTIDKAALEHLGGALTHLLRNAVDHGIESPAERRAAGKPACGHIRLSAWTEGAEALIQVSDDGRGVDTERVRLASVRMGLVDADRKLTDSEMFSMLFQPGLSTAQTVSTVSGRGVGMDAVQQVIKDLRGRIELDSRPGIGTTLTLRIPLAFSIMDCLLVRVGDSDCLIRLDLVEQCIDMRNLAIQETTGQLILHDTAIPLVDLGELLGVAESSQGNAMAEAVIVREGDSRYALAVDQVSGMRQAVLKPLGILADVPLLHGCAVADDGRLALVLDIPGLVKSVCSSSPASTLLKTTGAMP